MWKHGPGQGLNHGECVYLWIIITLSAIKRVSTSYLCLYVTVLACIQVLKCSSGRKADFQVPESQYCATLGFDLWVESFLGLEVLVKILYST